MDIYPSNFESKIGFDKVREILQGRCLSTLGKEQVEECSFSSSLETVERQLDETIEFVKILSEGMNFPNAILLICDLRCSGRKLQAPFWMCSKYLI